MELVGMAIDIQAVYATEKELSNMRDDLLWTLKQNPIIWHFDNILRTEALIDKNAKLKKKVMFERDFVNIQYNPGSNNQTRHLLYDIWGFDVIDKTDGGNPAVGAGTLKKLLNKLKLKYDITDEELEK